MSLVRNFESKCSQLERGGVSTIRLKSNIICILIWLLFGMVAMTLPLWFGDSMLGYCQNEPLSFSLYI